MRRHIADMKRNKNVRKGLLLDAIGGGLCPKHGEYLGHGKHNLKDCPFCDIREYNKQQEGTQ